MGVCFGLFVLWLLSLVCGDCKLLLDCFHLVSNLVPLCDLIDYFVWCLVGGVWVFMLGLFVCVVLMFSLIPCWFLALVSFCCLYCDLL